jgi:hypothetical protein
LLQARRLQRGGQLQRALVPLAIGVGAQALVGQARDDGVALEQRARTVHEMQDGQRHIHHRGLWTVNTFSDKNNKVSKMI